VELATLPQGARADLASNEARLSQSQAADAMGVSRSSVQRARDVREADPELHEKVKAGEVSRADAERIIEASGISRDDTEAMSNGDAFIEEKSRPISDEEKCIQQFKNLIKDLSKEFKTTATVIRNYLRRYLADYRRLALGRRM
jgi:hypothetical protein